MTTLFALRAMLNDELGVDNDSEEVPWSPSQRNSAIAQAYAGLWRDGVWKGATQSIATASDTWYYPLTSIRRMHRLELVDASGRVAGEPRAFVEDDFTGAGGTRLRLADPVAAGLTLEAYGWAPYKSVFTGDSDTDDLMPEHARIPIVKAKAILYRQYTSRYMRWGEAQALVPSMNVSLDGMLAGIAQAEREYAEAVKSIAGQRPRAGQPLRV